MHLTCLERQYFNTTTCSREYLKYGLTYFNDKQTMKTPQKKNPNNKHDTNAKDIKIPLQHGMKCTTL